jgi:hypothetical protein
MRLNDKKRAAPNEAALINKVDKAITPWALPREWLLAFVPRIW